jgi:NAD(P)-dependent dehydrogenase (short-subunit alcohol dehydrogenase family)
MSEGIAIIVGAGPGLGMSVARAFAGDGHPVALLDVKANLQRAEASAGELTEAGRVAQAYAVDAGDPADLTDVIGRVIEDLGAPEVLVYNPSLMQGDRPAEVSAKDWDRTLAVNLIGATVATNVVIPRLLDGHGTVLFTCGAYAVSPSPEATTLSVGLAARRAFGLALFEDQQPAGVHAGVVTIFGSIGTPGFEPDRIAQRYLDVHHQPKDQWSAESRFE